MVAFVGGETQGTGQRRQHLPGRAGTAGLLQARVVVHRHARQLRHLLAPQTGRTAPGARRQAHVRRAQAGAAPAQEVREFGSVHASSLRHAARRIQGLSIP